MFFRKTRNATVGALVFVLCLNSIGLSAQINIAAIEQMPRIPSPFNIPDYWVKAQNYDAFAFDAIKTGDYLPLLWWDDTQINVPWTGFGLPTYVGHYAQYEQHGNYHEALACISSVMSGTLVGVNKADQNGPGYTHVNFVKMIEDYYNSANNENVILNYTSTASGQSFWYETTPSLLVGALVSMYPAETGLATKFELSADSWYVAANKMRKAHRLFDYTSFNHVINRVVYNRIWTEPDCAAGIAYISYLAYQKWPTATKYKDATVWSLDYLQNRTTNPSYELQMPFGALIAARMNAEQGTNYDVAKFVDWCFSESVARENWGAILANWGGMDVYGLIGDKSDGGGYAFAMNTFCPAWPLVPLTRYDNRFARAIGKWMLNAANAARLFYPDYIDAASQDSWNWSIANCSTHCIPYEGLRATYNGQSPYATGDAIVDNAAPTNLSLYSGGWSGIFGAIISRTNNNYVLCLDCMPTDFLRPASHSTYLYYNPDTVAVSINLYGTGEWNYSLWDGVSNSWKRQNVRAGRTATFSIPADSATVIVVVPAGATITYDGNKMLANGIVVDYNIND
jgi:hypothetical protein